MAQTGPVSLRAGEGRAGNEHAFPAIRPACAALRVGEVRSPLDGSWYLCFFVPLHGAQLIRTVHLELGPSRSPSSAHWRSVVPVCP